MVTAPPSPILSYLLQHPPAGLLQHTIDLILILQFERFGRVPLGDTFSVQQKAERVGLHALALGVVGKYFGHFGGLFDFEEGLFSGLF